MSTQSFRALGASEHVCAALAQRGISEPFPIQELVLPDALAGRDVLAKSPTGSSIRDSNSRFTPNKTYD